MEPLSKIPGGMRYYFGREARLRRAVEDAAMSVFDGWGYEEIAAPPRPLRFCYAASVFRQRPRSHVEWRRQGRQLGCELIGSGGAAADLEVLTIAAEVLTRLGLRYCITLNHVGVFNGVAEQLNLDEAG